MNSDLSGEGGALPLGGIPPPQKKKYIYIYIYIYIYTHTNKILAKINRGNIKGKNLLWIKWNLTILVVKQNSGNFLSFLHLPIKVGSLCP